MITYGIYTCLVLLVVLVLVGATVLKQSRGAVISNRIWMKFCRVFLEGNTHRRSQIFNLRRSDVTFSCWRLWRYFTQKSAAAWWTHTQRLSAHMQQRPTLPDPQYIPSC